MLSEHWHWPFETHKFLDIHPHNYVWLCNRRQSSHAVEELASSGGKVSRSRQFRVLIQICAISTSSPILVIGVYLPTTNSPTDEYHHCLHTIENLINRHQDMPVIVAGEFNAHIGTRGGPRGSGDTNNQGSLLLEMISNNDLYVSSLSCISTGPLYTFFRENTMTTTDYIIVDALHSSMVSECSTLELHPLNSSDHLPLSIHLSVPTICSCSTPSPARLNWKDTCEDGSIAAYAAAVDEVIRPLLGKTYNSPSEVGEELSFVSSHLSMAASSLIPRVKTRPRNKKHFSSNPQLRELSSKCKAAWRKWRDAGRPRLGPEYEKK